MYDFQKIEAKWQERWAESGVFEVEADPSRPKFYNLTMYPYPSGALHQGHVRNYTYGDLSMTYEATRHPHTRMGLSDAGAHCGAICDGGMPTFMLTHWVRDRTRGPKLPLEHVVHRQTRQTAELYGLRDRGLIAPGLRADINVIDFDGLGFDVPKMAFDLPAGGRRLVQRGRGYVAGFVAGVQTVDHDEPTGQMPGRLLRGPR